MKNFNLKKLQLEKKKKNEMLPWQLGKINKFKLKE